MNSEPALAGSSRVSPMYRGAGFGYNQRLVQATVTETAWTSSSQYNRVTTMMISDARVRIDYQVADDTRSSL